MEEIPAGSDNGCGLSHSRDKAKLVVSSSIRFLVAVRVHARQGGFGALDRFPAGATVERAVIRFH